jgi:hypothetical protein
LQQRQEHRIRSLAVRPQLDGRANAEARYVRKKRAGVDQLGARPPYEIGGLDATFR